MYYYWCKKSNVEDDDEVIDGALELDRKAAAARLFISSVRTIQFTKLAPHDAIKQVRTLRGL